MPRHEPIPAAARLRPGGWPFVVLDLDGTLLVSGSGRGARWHAALCEAWPENPGASPGPDPLGRLCEGGAAGLFAALPEAWPIDRRERAVSVYGRLCEEARGWSGLTALPGAAALLERLNAAGQRLWVATNATQSSAERSLEGLGLADRLEGVIGIDPRRPEPKSERLRRWAEDLGWPEGVLLGDSAGDLEAAHAAGLVPLHYLGSGADPETGRGAAAAIQRLAELPDLLDRRPARVQALAEAARARGGGLAVDGGPPGAAERWARWLAALAGAPIRPWELAGWRLCLAAPARPGADQVLDLSRPLDPVSAECEPRP